MVKSLASALPLLASVLAFSALAPACSSSKSGSGFDTQNNGNGNGTSSGGGDNGGDDDTSIDGGTSGIFNNQDGGIHGFLDSGCATATAAASRQPVYMLFVLDGSGSMDQDNKWTAATAAIGQIFTDMKTKADPGVGVGLIVFQDSQDPTAGGFGGGGPYPSKADIPIAFVDQAQLTKLQNRISGTDQGGTPTGTAIGAPSGGGYGELTNFKPTGTLQPGGKKVLVLITDGVPTDTCATLGDGTDNYAQNACVTKAASELAAANAGIETFVIGVGVVPTTDFSNFDPYFLGALAQAGGSAPANCNPKENTAGASDFCYFQVDPSGSSTATQTAFETAINNIRGQVATCTFPLEGTDAGTIDPTKVNVVLNGQQIPEDPTNGWTYDNPSNPTEIILHGTACDTMKTQPSSKVDIVLGCATQVAK